MPSSKQARDAVSHRFDWVDIKRVADAKNSRAINRLLSEREMVAVIETWLERAHIAGDTLTAEAVVNRLHIRHTDAEKYMARAQGKEWIPPLDLDERIEQKRRLEEADAKLTALAEKLDAIYSERAELTAFLAAVITVHCSCSAVLCRNDPEWPELTVLYVNSPVGQVTWHIVPGDLWMFEHVPTVEPGSIAAAALATWDRHDTPEKRRRVRALTQWVLDSAAGAKTA